MSLFGLDWWVPIEEDVIATVKRATEDDWHHLREVRLSALADSPSAFGSSLDEATATQESAWREWARTTAVFVAFVEGAPRGMVAAASGESGAERKLVALWVDPACRGQGVASSLVSTVERWARKDGAQRLALWVTEGNESAERLYLAHGFNDSSERKPLPSNPTVQEKRLVLTLL